MILHADGSAPRIDQIFVFGSNLAGIHGAGAAKFAVQKLGAIWGQAKGLQGQSYAIPTKDKQIESLDLFEINEHVCDFIDFVIHHSEMNFFITRVGCVLAGYSDEEIAPMFNKIAHNINCSFPAEWAQYLTITI